MESVKTIYWKDLVAQLRENQNPKPENIDFKNEKIAAKYVSLLNRFGYRVPEELVFYDDNEIDFSDDADLTDADITTEKINWIYKAEIQLKPEVGNWIKQEKIDMKQLISNLVENFYQSMKSIRKNVAL